MVQQYEEVLNLFDDVPSARETRMLSRESKEIVLQKRGEGDNRLGILTYEDLVGYSVIRPI